MSCISPFEMWRVISNKAFNAVFCRLNTISVKPQAAQASRWNHRRPVKVFTKSDLQNDQQSEIIDLTNEFNHTESMLNFKIVSKFFMFLNTPIDLYVFYKTVQLHFES